MRTYRIQMAARLAGVTPDLVRAWERRYGVPTPARTKARYRVYSEADVALLRRLRQLTQEGMAIGEAAALVLRTPDAALAPAAWNGDDARIARWHTQMLEGAAELDQRAVEGALEAALAAMPPLQAYERLVVPVQRDVGERWHNGRLGVAEEHLVTQVVLERMGALLRAAPAGGPKHALCACFPDERHSVGLLGAALRLRHGGFRVTLLGEGLPLDELVRAVRRLKPQLVALSCVVEPSAAEVRRVATAVVKARPRGARVLAGGTGAMARRRDFEKASVEVVGDDAAWAALLV